MDTKADSVSARPAPIEDALLAFQESPGKFAIAKREPRVLFGGIRDVLQLASGRGLDGDAAPATEIQNAACFFVRTALLQPSADHYALLGLERTASADMAKDRYRLMMRLMHPDFEIPGSGNAWPADTAARVNRAYEVLASAEKRQAYDAELEQGAPSPAESGSAPTSAAAARAATSPVRDPRKALKGLAAVFGLVGLVLVAAILFSGTERENLVQRGTAAEEQMPIVASAPTPKIAPVPEPKPAPPKAEPPSEAIVTAAMEPARTDEPAPLPIAPAAKAVTREIAPKLRQLELAPRAPLPLYVPATKVAVAAVRKNPIVIVPAPAPAPVTALALAPAPAPPARQLGDTTPAPSLRIATTITEPASPQANVASKPNPGVTLAEVHPLLTRLVQQVETGAGERLLVLLDRDAQGSAAAQALVRQFNSIVDGGSVKVSYVQFRTEPQEGRLLVTGYLIMDVGPPAPPPSGRELTLQAEFRSRNGAAVMTGLSRAQPRSQ